MRAFLWILALSSALALPQGRAAWGQVPDSLRILPDSVSGVLPQEVPPDSAALPPTPELITPRGAFIRSALVPGWGHAEVGAYGRGAFYFLVEAASGFMILKTQSRLGLARDRVRLRETMLTRQIMASGVDDPFEIEDLLKEDEVLQDLRGLEEARGDQREDWVALGIFFLFLGGADAYVSAHLKDFPGAVEVNATPVGGVEVGISVPVNF